MTDEQIMRALVHQVSRAAKGGSRLVVKTVLTRPMWDAFWRGSGCKIGYAEAGAGHPFPYRIHGSLVTIVESDAMESYSLAPRESATKIALETLRSKRS